MPIIFLNGINELIFHCKRYTTTQVFWDVKPRPLVNIYWRFVVKPFMKRSWTAWALKFTATTFPDYVRKNVRVGKMQQ